MTPEENQRRINKLRAGEDAPENRRAARRHRVGRASKNQGTTNGQAKLSPAQVRQIRDSGESNRALAERIGVSASLIGKVKRGDLWGHVA